MDFIVDLETAYKEGDIDLIEPLGIHTPAGKLAAQGKYEAAEYLHANYGAGIHGLAFGAASRGYDPYVEKLLSRYANSIIDAIGTGAALGGHWTFVEELRNCGQYSERILTPISLANQESKIQPKQGQLIISPRKKDGILYLEYCVLVPIGMKKIVRGTIELRDSIEWQTLEMLLKRQRFSLLSELSKTCQIYLDKNKLPLDTEQSFTDIILQILFIRGHALNSAKIARVIANGAACGGHFDYTQALLEDDSLADFRDEINIEILKGAARGGYWEFARESDLHDEASALIKIEPFLLTKFEPCSAH